MLLFIKLYLFSAESKMVDIFIHVNIWKYCCDMCYSVHFLYKILIIIPTNAQLVLLYTVRLHVREQYIIKLIVHLLV
jgi:hypothetical protein